MRDKKIVSILGCGWYGFALAGALLEDGLGVKGSTTTPQKLEILRAEGIEPYLINLDPDNENIDTDFFDCDILFISIPPKIRSGNGEGYISKINHLIDIIKTTKIEQVIFVSSTGVYADDNTIVNELSDTVPDSESGKALLVAERLLQQQNGFTTTIIRFAGLIGPGRHPGRFLAGKKAIPNGDAPVNLIHLEDCIGISRAVLTKQVFGHVFNGSSPNHPAKAAFYTKAAVKSNLEPPEFIKEKTNWKIVDSINVPVLLSYNYSVDNLMEWLDE